MPAMVGLALGVVALWTVGARGQQCVIDQATIVSITSLNSTQSGQIDRCVQEAVAELTSDDPERVSAGRARLIAPLETEGVGVPFRLAYSNALCPTLEAMAGREDEIAAMNALRLLGEVATDRASLAVEQGLDHPAVGPRYTAVYAVSRTFDAVAGQTPAVAPQRVDALMSRLAELIRNEQDPWVLDMAVRALVTAGTIDKENFTQTRESAYRLLGEALGDRVRTMGSDEGGSDRAQFMLRATVAARDALTDTRGLQGPAATALAGMGGDVLAYLAERVQRADEISPEEREMLYSISRTAQAVNHFAGVAAGSQAAPPEPMPDVRGSASAPGANDERFVRAAVAEVTRLEESGNPFGFTARRFTRP